MPKCTENESHLHVFQNKISTYAFKVIAEYKCVYNENVYSQHR